MGWFLAEPPVRFLRFKPYWNCVCLPSVIIGVRTMTHLKLRQIGNSLGVVLPQEVVASLGAVQGDMLTVVRTENGIELTPYDPGFDEDVAAAKTVMRRYRNALRELAK